MAANEIDRFLLPGMMNKNVGDALSALANMCNDMKEWQTLSTRIHSRLQFLRDHHAKKLVEMKIVTFAETLGAAINVLKKYLALAGLLQMRIAATRSLLTRVRAVHEKIDALVHELALGNADEVLGWRETWDADIEEQARRFQTTLEGPPTSYTPDAGTLEEANTALLYEHERKEAANAPVHLDVIRAALASQGLLPPASPLHLPSHFIPRYELDQHSEALGHGFIGQIYKAEWGPERRSVVMKGFFVDAQELQKPFLIETAISSRLRHPRLLKYFGSSHVGKPLFTVIEYASLGNFKSYFADPAHRGRFWQLVLQAAEGLAFLHENNVIHGALRCDNLLIGSDGDVRVSDYGFSVVRSMSAGRSLNNESALMRWSAPECLLQYGTDSEPSVLTDAYSFGMVIIEAKTQALPWAPMLEGDDGIYELIDKDGGYPRPEGDVFSESEWRAVEALTKFDPTERSCITAMLDTLGNLAKEEMERGACQAAACTASAIKISCACGHANPPGNKFCGECGERMPVTA